MTPYHKYRQMADRYGTGTEYEARCARYQHRAAIRRAIVTGATLFVVTFAAVFAIVWGLSIAAATTFSAGLS